MMMFCFFIRHNVSFQAFSLVGVGVLLYSLSCTIFHCEIGLTCLAATWNHSALEIRIESIQLGTIRFNAVRRGSPAQKSYMDVRDVVSHNRSRREFEH